MRLVEEGREECPGIASYPSVNHKVLITKQYYSLTRYMRTKPLPPYPSLIVSMGHYYFMKEMTKWSRPGNKVADCIPSIKAYSEIVSGSDSAERRSGLLIVSAKRIKQHP